MNFNDVFYDFLNEENSKKGFLTFHYASPVGPKLMGKAGC